ncbi:MAG: 5-(carboxyamino)imidazole ribonucleotide synthase [Anaerolineae bacterium]|nr:5-(carboxyamino)imidazole ribonucleotide synthase [Anaerolineae bacterium]
MPSPILPGAIIGILGSGQLGRMLAIAARTMGYRVAVFSPGSSTPTGQIANLEVTADYNDLDAVRDFAQQVDVVTYEFENVPAATAAAVAEFVPLRPGTHVLHVAQNRLREKDALAAAGLPVTPYRPVRSSADLERGVAELGLPCILKTAESGYDGKGQVRLDSAENLSVAWHAMQGREAILESFVPFERELSVVAARGSDGAFAHYGVIENDHVNHILDVSTAPSVVGVAISAEAERLTRAVLKTLDVVGVLCVEYFLTGDGSLLINEIAPRPHNSGHLTIDACVTSQFEQQLRAVCGLPLGSADFHAPAAMVNLLGDLWQNGEPDWQALCAFPRVKLHLYGKQEARIGRKMGHITATADTTTHAKTIALRARHALTVASY